MTRLRILFVDFAPEPGGSIQSLLLLLRHLDRDRFAPLVLLSPAVARLPAFLELGLPIFSYDAGQGTAIPRRWGRGGRVRPRGRAVEYDRGDGRSSTTAGRGGRVRPRGGAVEYDRGDGRSSTTAGTDGLPTGASSLRQWASIARRLWLRTRPTSAFIAHLITQQRVDLVHLNDALPLAEPGILAAWRRRRPSLVTVRSFTPLDPLHRRLSRLPALGIVTSAALAEDQIKQGARFRRQIILPNAIDLAPYAAPPDRAGVRAELSLPPDARLAIVVGRLMRRKGLDAFIQALAQIAPAFPTLHGLIAGQTDFLEPEIEAEWQGLARELGVAERLRFTGFREDIPRLLLASDLLCFVPAQPEPFGRTVIEAMAAGLPVIAAATGALPHLVGDGETGLLVPPADPAALAAALHRLLSDPALAASMGRAGRHRAGEHFGIEQQAAALAEIYLQVGRA